MTKKDYQTKMLRHGELLIVPLDEMPKGVMEVYKGKSYIIGHSETGHHHLAVADAVDAITIYKPVGADSQDLYMRVSSPAKVEHQKTHDRHVDIDLPEGVYLVRGKNEYDPFAKLIQRVRD